MVVKTNDFTGMSSIEAEYREAEYDGILSNRDDFYTMLDMHMLIHPSGFKPILFF